MSFSFLYLFYRSSDSVTHADKNVLPRESASSLSASLDKSAKDLKGITRAGLLCDLKV